MNYDDENRQDEPLTPDEIKEFLADPSVSDEEKEKFLYSINTNVDTSTLSTVHECIPGVNVSFMGRTPVTDYRNTKSSMFYFKFTVTSMMDYDAFYLFLTESPAVPIALCYYYNYPYWGDCNREIRIFSDNDGLWAIMCLSEDEAPEYLDEPYVYNNDVVVNGSTKDFNMYPAMLSLRTQKYYCKNSLSGAVLSILPLDGKCHYVEDIPVQVFQIMTGPTCQTMRGICADEPVVDLEKAANILENEKPGSFMSGYLSGLVNYCIDLTWGSTITIMDDRIANIIQYRALPDTIHKYGIKRMHRDNMSFCFKPTDLNFEIGIGELLFRASCAEILLHSGADYLYIPNEFSDGKDKFYGNNRYWNIDIPKYSYIDLDFGTAHIPHDGPIIETDLYTFDMKGIGLFLTKSPVEWAIGLPKFCITTTYKVYGVLAIDMNRRPSVDIIDTATSAEIIYKRYLQSDFELKPAMVHHSMGVYYFLIASQPDKTPSFDWKSKFKPYLTTREMLVKKLDG